MEVKSDDLEDLAAKVERMRALGVREWGDIKLGPAVALPPKELTPEELKERMAKTEARRQDIMFAASASRPYLKAVKR